MCEALARRNEGARANMVDGTSSFPCLMRVCAHARRTQSSCVPQGYGIACTRSESRCDCGHLPSPDPAWFVHTQLETGWAMVTLSLTVPRGANTPTLSIPIQTSRSLSVRVPLNCHTTGKASALAGRVKSHPTM